MGKRKANEKKNQCLRRRATRELVRHCARFLDRSDLKLHRFSARKNNYEFINRVLVNGGFFAVGKKILARWCASSYSRNLQCVLVKDNFRRNTRITKASTFSYFYTGFYAYTVPPNYSILQAFTRSGYLRGIDFTCIGKYCSLRTRL